MSEDCIQVSTWNNFGPGPERVGWHVPHISQFQLKMASPFCELFREVFADLCVAWHRPAKVQFVSTLVSEFNRSLG
jgi:hypothetical protein